MMWASVLQARASEKGLTSGVDIGASCPRLVIGDAARHPPGADEPDRHRAEVHRRGLGAVACERDRCGRAVAAQLRRHRHRQRSQQGRARANCSRRCSRFRARRSTDPAAPGSSSRSRGSSPTLMGGEVGCDSVVGKGSLYWFTLAEQAHDSALRRRCAGEASRAASQAFGSCPRGRGQCRQPHADRRPISMSSA